MDETIREIQHLLKEAVGHLQSGTKPDSREAANKLKRIVALASTLAPDDRGTPFGIGRRRPLEYYYSANRAV